MSVPIYEFECSKCGHRFEKIQKLSDAPPSKCPQCGHRKVSRLLSAPAIQFKGTGWYVTDYARKSSTEASSGNGSKSKGKESSGSPAGESAAASSESKPEAKGTTTKES